MILAHAKELRLLEAPSCPSRAEGHQIPGIDLGSVLQDVPWGAGHIWEGTTLIQLSEALQLRSWDGLGAPGYLWGATPSSSYGKSVAGKANELNNLFPAGQCEPPLLLFLLLLCLQAQAPQHPAFPA